MRGCAALVVGLSALVVTGCQRGSPRLESGATSGARLEVALRYHAGASPELTLLSARVVPGVAPQREVPAAGPRLVLFDRAGGVRLEARFVVPNLVPDPPPEPGETARGAGAPLTMLDFALTLPWHPEGARVALLDENGVIVEALDVLVDTTTAFGGRASVADGAAYLDIALIGHGYGAEALAAFHYDVERFREKLGSTEPFRARSARIRLHEVDNTDDLGCAFIADRLRVCDNARVTARVNASGVPYDKIFVIANSEEYGGSGGEIGVAYNGAWGENMFLHEFGHSFAGLLDEYVRFGENGTESIAVRSNCLACAGGTCTGLPAAWAGLVALGDLAPGCDYPNWYRSSADSIMRSIDNDRFNAVSAALVSRKLDLYLAELPLPTPAPTAVPTVMPTVLPTPAPTPAPLGAPELLGASLGSFRRVALAWRDRSTSERYFTVERSTTSSSGVVSAFVRVTMLSANATRYTDTLPLTARSARYRIWAIDAGGRAAGSNVLTVDRGSGSGR